MFYIYIYNLNLSQEIIMCTSNAIVSGILQHHQLFIKTKMYMCKEMTIKNVDKCAFKNIYCAIKYDSYPLLSIIDLRNNRIEYLNKITFGALIHMNELYLSNNKIEYLPVTLFINNTQLRVFDIKNNLLNTLPTFLFKYNNELTSIFIDNNNLNNFNIDTSNLLKLTYLSLKGNPLTSLNSDTIGKFLVRYYVGKLKITVDFFSFRNTCYCDKEWISSKINIINQIIINEVNKMKFCNYTHRGDICNKHNITNTS